MRRLLAQIAPITQDQAGQLGLQADRDLVEFAITLTNIFLSLVGVVAGIFIIIAGVQYITAHGETQTIEKAKRTIIYAVVGLIIVGLSAAVVNFVLGAFV